MMMEIETETRPQMEISILGVIKQESLPLHVTFFKTLSGSFKAFVSNASQSNEAELS